MSPTILGEYGAVLANREIKDGLFRLIFENPECAAELYTSITDEPCTPDEVQIITITTVISGKLKNDLAFIVRGRVLVIGEHMAGPYANMPVRMLMYVGQLYDKWIKMRGEEKFLYSSKQYKIPTPEFVVLYNGVAERPEKEILHLSTAFECTPDKNLGSLELTVPVYNINKGMNATLFKKSDKLRQYADFIAKLRELNGQYGNYTQAVKDAVTHCIENNILSEILREHGGRIMSVLEMPYNEEAAQRVQREEAWEDGLEVGRENMREGIIAKLLAKNSPIDFIMEITGADESDVLRIQQACTA